MLPLLAALMIPPPPPVISTSPTSSKARFEVVEYRPGAVRCDGQVVTPSRLEAPFPTGSYHVATRPAEPTSIRLDFAIDAEGTPVSIRRADNRFGWGDSSDIEPSLAASRFPARAMRGCTIDYVVESRPVDAVPPATLYRFLATPGSRGNREAWARIRPAGNCSTGKRPLVRSRAFPHWEALPEPAGGWNYAYLTHDIAADGTPANVRISGSSGSPEFDREAIRAASESRFAPEARTGCSVHYKGAAYNRLPPPPRPDLASFRRAGDNCPADIGERLLRDRAPVFPRAFGRRHIEGWAVIRFDVAPWGAIGNVEIAAAEPAQGFGETARGLLLGAKAATSAGGHTGCLVPVRYALPDRDVPDDAMPDTD